MDQELLKDTVEQLEEIADIIYEGAVSTGIAEMNKVIPNLAVISTWITDEDTKKRLVNDALAPILAAMESKDGTMLADLINYELVDVLNSLM